MVMLRGLTLVFIILLLLTPAAYPQQADAEHESFFVAQKAYADGFYDVSLNLFRRFLRRFPQSEQAPEANLYIAQSYFQQGKFIPALTLLEKLSDEPAAQKIKDRVIYWIGEVHYSSKEYRRAISFYRRIINEYPDSEVLVYALYSKGWCLFELKEFEKAHEFFSKVSEKFPDDTLTVKARFKILDCLYNLKDYPRLRQEGLAFGQDYPADAAYINHVHFLLAEAAYYLDDYQTAIKQYEIVIAHSKDSGLVALAQLGLAWCKYRIKEYPSALSLLEGLNRRDLSAEGSEGLLLAQANVFSELKDYAAALDAWSELLELSEAPMQKAQAYLGKAGALYNLGRFTEAIFVYQQARDISLGLPRELRDRLHYGLAWAYLKDGQFRRAIEEFQKAASYAADEIIRVASLCQAADTYQDAQEYEQAIEAYGRILKDYPESFYADYIQYQLGLAYFRIMRYDAAALAFKTLLHNFSRSKLRPQAVYSLGLTFFQEQDYLRTREVLEQYQADLEGSRFADQGWYLLATSLYNLGEYSQALENFRQVIRVASDEGIIQKAEYEIADCLYQLGKEKEAIRSFQHIRTKYPDSTLAPEVTYWLGGYYFRRGELVLSRRYFNSLIRDFPEKALLADGYYALGLLDQEEGNYEAALENFRKAVSFGSRDIAAQANIASGDILLGQGRPDEAIGVYRQALEIAPAFAGAVYTKISEVYLEKGEYDAAIKIYRQALREASLKDAARLQLKIARVFEEKGDFGQAIEEYLKIVYLYPVDPELVIRAYLSSAAIYENQKQYNGARDIYLKIASMDIQEAKYAQERLEWLEKETRNQKPENRNQRTETREQKPENRNQRTETRKIREGD